MIARARAKVEKLERMRDGESRGSLLYTGDMKPIEFIYNNGATDIMEVLWPNRTTTAHLDMKHLKQRTKSVKILIYEAKSTLNSEMVRNGRWHGGEFRRQRGVGDIPTTMTNTKIALLDYSSKEKSGRCQRWKQREGYEMLITATDTSERIPRG